DDQFGHTLHFTVRAGRSRRLQPKEFEPRDAVHQRDLLDPVTKIGRHRTPFDAQGSRKLSSITRVIGFRMYSSTERRPTLMSPTRRMPGRKAKPSGRLRNSVRLTSTRPR